MGSGVVELGVKDRRDCISGLAEAFVEGAESWYDVSAQRNMSFDEYQKHTCSPSFYTTSIKFLAFSTRYFIVTFDFQPRALVACVPFSSSL